MVWRELSDTPFGSNSRKRSRSRFCSRWSERRLSRQSSKRRSGYASLRKSRGRVSTSTNTAKKAISHHENEKINIDYLTADCGNSTRRGKNLHAGADRGGIQTRQRVL